jgi:hypothetical protein
MEHGGPASVDWCEIVCVGIFTKTLQETSCVIKTGKKTTETLCKCLCTYIMFMYVHNFYVRTESLSMIRLYN